MNCIFIFIEVFNKFLYSAFIVESFVSLSSLSFVFENDFDAFVEKCHFSQPMLQSIKIKDRCFGKYFRIRPKDGLWSCLPGFAYYLQLGYSLSSFIALLIYFAVSLYFHFHMGWKGVHYRGAYAMKTSGYLISSAAEFTSCMKDRVDDFHCRYSHLRMVVHRHSSPVILHHDWIILLNCNIYSFTVSCQSFVNTVIHDFVNKMMKSLRTGASYIHTRSFSHSFKSFKYLNLRRVILSVCFFFQTHFFTFLFLKIDVFIIPLFALNFNRNH